MSQFSLVIECVDSQVKVFSNNIHIICWLLNDNCEYILKIIFVQLAKGI